MQDWKENERLNKDLRSKAKEMQVRLEEWVKDWAKFEELALKVYKSMPENDAMFFDSPIAPGRLQMAFRGNLAKLGWKWACGLPWGPENVRKFADIVDDACKWGERILKDKETLAKKKAQTKIVEKAQDDLGAIV
jgi:hypothetical protein